MKVLHEGPPPSWLGGCTDQALRVRLGADTWARGAAYARDRAVQSVETRAQGLVLHATVRGSRSRSYSTLVRAHQVRRGGGSVDWTGHCTCPIQVDCKHVAAVLLATRDRLSGAPAPVSSWESQLADVVHPVASASTIPPLGLQLEVVGTAPARLRLRPVRPGKAGRWVRTGMSWRDLDSTYGSAPVRPEQQAVARSILAAFRGRQASYYSPYSDVSVHLDDLGPSGWRLLTEAQEAGIALVGTQPEQSVRLSAEPAVVLLDVRRDQPDADLHLVPTVRVVGEPDLPDSRLRLVGSPAHGLFVDAPEDLLLAPFSQPLDDGTSRLLHSGALRVPAPDAPRFLSRYYPALRQRVTVESRDGSVELPTIEPPSLALAVDFQPGHRTALQWSFSYAAEGESVRVPLDAAQEDGAAEVVRDAAAERALLAALTELPNLPGLWEVDEGRRRPAANALLTGLATARFVDQALPALLEDENVTVHVTGTPAEYLEAEDTPLIVVSASDAADGHPDWFDLSVEVSVAGQSVPLSPLITALARDEEQLILDSGTWFRLDHPELQALRRIIEEARSLQDRESTGLRVTPYQAGLWEELAGLGVVEHQSERWSRTVGGLLALEELPRPEPPLKLQATLRPYQLDGYHWLSLLWDCQLGGILADDMGLGKTLQTLAMATRAYEQGTLGGEAGPLLIVAPTSVVAAWASEAERFCPDLAVVAITQTEHRSGRVLAEQAAGAHLVVTSYALFRIDEETYRGLTWSGLVLDEAQFVKNHQAKTYQCARRLPAPFKLAITGTPLENSLMDLWSMLSITAPGLFPDPQTFTDLYRRPIESGSSPEQLATLRRRIRPLMLRRTKDQVATDLPPKVEQVLEVELNPKHRKVYDKHLQRERQRVLGLLDDLQRHRFQIFRSLTLLRQLSLDPSLVDDQYAGRIRSSKIDVLMEQLREVVDEGHRVLVFSQFTGFLSLVRSRLEQEGIGHCYLDGRTRNRPKRIAEFTSGDAPVFLISLKAGGVGLTLTEADYVFVLDPWWNPATEAQAVDRAHRIGQDKTVMVYRLVATGTIEEKVVALQQRKRDLFAQVVDDDAMTGGALTAEDIRGLFA
ncbi:MAG: DEAD/DEAH box helicase [Mycobacteriales bacterium]